MRRLFRQFSTPGGVPSHVSVPTPGSIHEGGELGYSLVHAFGAAFDNPDLVVACVVGDGEAETGPLEGSWKGVHFLNPARDGAVLPILHLNGYKIGNPTVLGRSSDDDIASLLAGHGYDVSVRRGRRADGGARAARAALDRRTTGSARSRPTRGRTASGPGPDGRRSCCARRRGGPDRGWSTVSRSRGRSAPIRCRSRTCASDPEHLGDARGRGCAATEPETLFDETGRLGRRARRARAERRAPHGREPARERRTRDRPARPARLPGLRDRGRRARATSSTSRRAGSREWLRDIFVRNADAANFRITCPDEARSNRLDPVFEVENRCTMDPVLPTDDHERRTVG